MSSGRLQVNYENRSSHFYRNNQEFKKQFCHIYAARLQKLGIELLKEKAQKKFGKKFNTLKASLITSLTSRQKAPFQEHLGAQWRLTGDLHHYRHSFQRPSYEAQHSQGNLWRQPACATTSPIQLQRWERLHDFGRWVAENQARGQDQCTWVNHRSDRSCSW